MEGTEWEIRKCLVTTTIVLDCASVYLTHRTLGNRAQLPKYIPHGHVNDGYNGNLPTKEGMYMYSKLTFTIQTV
jgi:hypothetical protein